MLRGQKAILGGSFDPVHCGHLALARAARKAFALSEVIFMPAGHSPGKSLSGLFDDATRLALLRAALLAEEGLSVSEYELKHSGPSYTVETALALGASENAPIYWIIGADCARALDRWYRPELLARLVVFLVASREGEEPSPAPGFSVIQFDCPRVDSSSTLVRQRLKAGRSVDGLVPPEVARLLYAQKINT